MTGNAFPHCSLLKRTLSLCGSELRRPRILKMLDILQQITSPNSCLRTSFTQTCDKVQRIEDDCGPKGVFRQRGFRNYAEAIGAAIKAPKFIYNFSYN